ncbi:MAG: UDP-N-acetylglucosamine--N-acetylmuramyl-(pentapeptide) pyrophosphoryl-undecaprenol N-acetylglucosamine transferase [Planctomycetota bacterium]
MSAAAGILFCGGGTGGHVFPGLAVAAACRARGEHDLRWVGDPARLEARLVPQAGISLLPFGLSRPRPRDPRWLVRSLLQLGACWRELRRRPPRVVVALGGYAALIPGLLAPLLRRPLVVLEQNARAGRTNRLLARRANAVVTQFAEAARDLPRSRVHCLGNPIRPLRPQVRGRGPVLRVLVMGGSLAARSLNDLLLAAAPGLASVPDLELVHLAGEADRPRMVAAYGAAGLPVEVLGFCEDMPALYSRVDLVLGRAGATTVAECCAAGLGALYVPLPWAAEDHQTANARAVARHGGAVVLRQADLRPAGLVRLLRRLATRRDEVARLGRGAQRLGRPGAAQAVAALLAGVSRR